MLVDYMQHFYILSNLLRDLETRRRITLLGFGSVEVLAQRLHVTRGGLEHFANQSLGGFWLI